MIKSKKHLTSLLGISFIELERIVSSIDTYYYRKDEIKTFKNGTPKLDRKGNPRIRTLYPSRGKLKLIQKKIKGAILSKLPLEDCVFGGVRGKDNIGNGKKHKGKKYKFLTDLKDFFPSIRPKMVYKALISYGFSPDIASILTKLTTYKNQVPQGAPTSTHISNIALSELDEEISSICSKHGITVTRYVDDMTFSADQCFKEVTFEIIDLIKKYNLGLSHKKTGYVIGSAPITGVWTRNNNLDVSDNMKYKLTHPERFNQNQIRGQRVYYQRVISS